MSNAKSLAVPVLIIAIGLGWLLTVHNIVPGVNWVWVLGLGFTGILILAGGIDKVSFVFGPFLLAATFFSLLRQTNYISIDTEIPSLVIALGTLMLFAKLLPIPLPHWVTEPQKQEPQPSAPAAEQLSPVSENGTGATREGMENTHPAKP